MPKRVWIAVGMVLAAGGPPARTVRADEVLYRYECNTVPYDSAAGWIVADPCDPPCSESLQPGRFRLSWPQAANLANYHLWIAEAQTPPAPPSSLWVEWRFRSNHPLGQFFSGCDGQFAVHYKSTHETTNMYGDAAISQSGDQVIENLPLFQFHTYRYESVDGLSFRVTVNGQVLLSSGPDSPDNGAAFLQLRGLGGCISDQIPNMVNEWDYVRYGTIDSGEQIVGVDPPAGQLGPEGYTSFTTFRVTFDVANYVYIDDIAVSVTGGTAPIVTATRRRETDDVDTVEIVLDRALPNNQRTRFTFTDVAGTQHIDYDFREPVPPVPSIGTSGALLTASAILLAGLIALRRRMRNGM